MITAGVQAATPLLPTVLPIFSATIAWLTIALALLKKLLEVLAVNGVPLAHEHMALVINVNLGMPWQAVIAGVNLIRLSGLVEGR
jgi:hypothetical protein